MPSEPKPARHEPPRPVVLVVEDNDDLRWSYRLMLETDEFRLLEAGDAESAMNSLARHPVDVVVTELYMGGTTDGVGLINAIRKRGRRPAIVAMSGVPHIAYRSTLQAAGHPGTDASLTKPFTRVNLVRTIRSLIGGDSAGFVQNRT